MSNGGRSVRPAPSRKDPGASFAIERMTHEGINEICALYKRVWDHVPNLSPELVKRWTPTALEFSSWMEGVTYFIARSDGRLVGAVGCEIADGSCRLLRLAVDQPERRHGIGSALTEQGLEWARTHGCATVWVDALDQFGDAAKLLRKLGFAESGVLHRHYFGTDVRLFEKLL